MSNSLRVALYRLRSTGRRRAAELVGLTVLIALIGGVAMASVAGARRSVAAFPTYLASSRASTFQVDIWNLAATLSGPATSNYTARLEKLPDVADVTTAPTMIIVPLRANGQPTAQASAIFGTEVNIVGSVGGMYFSRDRVTVARGRLADPRDEHEMNASAAAARIMHWRLGETVTFGAFTPREVETGTFEPTASSAYALVRVKLVGLVVFANAVAHDDVDRYPTEVLITPALTHRFARSQTLPLYGVTLKDGQRGVAPAERRVIASLPRSTVYAFHTTSVVEGQVQRAVRPEAYALGAFGVIAGLAVLIIGGLALSRRLWADAEDMRRLRSLGADRSAITVDASLGPIVAIVVGSLGAVAVAVGLSALTLVGPSRVVDPSPGYAVDPLVLGAGFTLLVVVLGGVALALAVRRGGPERTPIGLSSESSTVAGTAARAGLALTPLMGLRFSLHHGRGRGAVSTRSVLVGSVLAVTVVSTTLTFGSGLSTLVARPALYGWNWDLAISAGAGGSVPPIGPRLLNADPEVAAWSGYSYGDVQLDGVTVPSLNGDSRSRVQPPILSGHGLEADNQVVLGAATLAALHKRIGDTVDISYGRPQNKPVYIAPQPLTIVGTATMPAIGTSGTFHPSMGVGALFSNAVESPSFIRAISSPDPNLNGPNIIVIRLRHGVSVAAGRASLAPVVTRINRALRHDPSSQGDDVALVGAQRPAEIVAYESSGSTPLLLAGGLVVGVVVALGLALASSVRRRRRDLAVLKTLGFTHRQLAAVIAWQATIIAAIGCAVGIPAGIVVGRELWSLFARSIDAVPDPTVPGVAIVLTAAGSLLFANAVAAWPGRSAARTSAALVLRAP